MKSGAQELREELQKPFSIEHGNTFRVGVEGWEVK